MIHLGTQVGSKRGINDEADRMLVEMINEGTKRKCNNG